MKKLKFRVWNEEVKKYMEVDLNGNFKLGYIGAFGGNVWEIFIGKYDINSHEIYEGDIVKVLYNQKEFMCVAYFNEFESSFKLADGEMVFKEKEIKLNLAEEIEIIGNIHRNKLEEFKKTLED
jgi:uncharacterized phage protein (TIGR01671 family)